MIIKVRKGSLYGRGRGTCIVTQFCQIQIWPCRAPHGIFDLAIFELAYSILRFFLPGLSLVCLTPSLINLL